MIQPGAASGQSSSVIWRKQQDYDGWYFAGNRRHDNGAGSVVAARSDLRLCSLADLRKSLLRSKKHEYLPDYIHVAFGGLGEFDEDYVPVEPVSFLLLDDERVAVEVMLDIPHDEDPFEILPAMVDAVGPYLSRSRATLVRVEDADPLLPRLIVTAAVRGRSMKDLFDIGMGVHLLSNALMAHEPAREALRDLLLAGRFDLLIGQGENDWFDAKADHYLYNRSSEGRIKLARAVAQFCNGEHGGLVVVGARARGRHGAHGEWVTDLTPVPVDGKTQRHYRDALEKHLFPFPQGLTIDIVDAPGKPGQGYVVLSLPPQPEEVKPYLVHGAFVAGKAEGSYFTIIRRSGEDGLALHPSQVHNMLVTGRALLRHGIIPRGDADSPEPPPAGEG